MRGAEKRSRLRLVLEFLRRLLGKRPGSPGDPYAYSMAPIRRGPKGRSGAAVVDPEEHSFRAFPLRPTQ
jgi:hypothetical protein